MRSGESVPRTAYTCSQTTGGLRESGAIDARAAAREFASGATLVLQALHRFVPSVQNFCHELEDFFGHPLQANAYLTPEGARGLGVHHDTHDVLVLQLFGSKSWRLYPQAVVDAVDGYPASQRHPELETPDSVLTLSPGDCLYLPRGLPHDAESTAGASLHLTLGIRSPTWLDVLGRALKSVHEIPQLRASLPLNYASNAAARSDGLALKLREVLDRTSSWLQGLDEQELAASEMALQRERKRSPRGAITQFAALEPVQATTVFERNHPDRWVLHGDSDHALLLVGLTALEFPARIKPALEHLLSQHRISAEGFGACLDSAGALVLVKRLHQEGLLVRTDA
ncbi:MAG TPA: cupin domain-containing protein [Dokdonella sp.]|uniref:cupin domain-containing protein n=1 Tax=Dokdonella sp. TaxID=2291710 RepID=UPI002D7F7677|nr:cupin domain-containing protein [Dokdonella sp.]HET9032833.1 cupin domain-containing protein [Dokdonella sp.]